MEKKGLLLLLLPLLFSCTISGAAFEPYPYGDLVSEPFSAKTSGNCSRALIYKSLKSADEGSISPSFSSIYQSKGSGGVEHYNLPSTGIQKLLVIPVDFAEPGLVVEY